MSTITNEFQEARTTQRLKQNGTFCKFAILDTMFQVYELSTKGFSFISENIPSIFQKDISLSNILIYNSDGDVIIKASGIIKHISEYDIDTCRIGIEYLNKSLDRTITGRIRVPRKTARIALFALIKSDEVQCHASVKDYTAFNLRLAFDKSIPHQLQIGSILKLFLSGPEEYSFESSAIVTQIRSDNAELIVKLTDQPLDCEVIIALENAAESVRILKKTLSVFESYLAVPDSFKACTSDWRMMFSKLKKVIDIEEKKQLYRTSDEEIQLFKTVEPQLFKTVNALTVRLNSLADTFDTATASICKSYFRENMMPYLRTSPLLCSIIDKVHGYAGDYEVVKQFFSNPYVGESLFGKLLNKYVCSLSAVRAHRERIDYIYETILYDINKSTQDYRFISLGSGPAEEVLRLVDKNTFIKPIHATLIDMDANALTNFSERLQYVQKNNFTIDLINANIISILRKKEWDSIPRSYDLAYSAGVFDYFGNSVCQRMVQYLMRHVKKDGYVIVTNVHRNNFSRHIMDYCGQWEIVHRNEEEMSLLVPEGHTYSFFYDSTKTNIFLKIDVT
jgi:hypothetical protein